MSAKKRKAPVQDSTPVGYGKPPVHTRFRKGQSGNPTSGDVATRAAIRR